MFLLDFTWKGVGILKQKKILSATIVFMMIATMALPTYHVKAQEVRETWISNEYLSCIEEICAEYCICPELVMAIIERESSGQTDAINGDCKGLMQISENWHKDRMERLGVSDLYDPCGNILVGVDYLAELASEYDDLGTVLMIYSGSADAIKRGETGDWSDYAKEVVERTMELERLHGK